MMVFVLFGLYFFLIAAFIVGFNKVTIFKPTKKIEKSITKFSVVVPFRDEAQNLPNILLSIDELDYPKELFEVIFVDDDSKDNSVEIIDSYREKNPSIKIISNQRISNSPKKDAITTAVECSVYDWIVTTDADCVFSKKWLSTFDSYIRQNECIMLAAPVKYRVNNSFFEQFQLLDFLSLQGATIGGFGIKAPFMCNGANLCYQKSIFLTVNGFFSNNHIASGDDVFLFEKFLKFDASQVHYLKSTDALVTTFPVKTVKQLIYQRMRWASKAANYQLLISKIIGFIVFLGNLIIVLFPVLCLKLSLESIGVIFFLKFLIDALLIYKTSHFFNQKLVFFNYVLSSVWYPFFSVGILVISLVKKYSWKGRVFQK